MEKWSDQPICMYKHVWNYQDKYLYQNSSNKMGSNYSQQQSSEQQWLLIQLLKLKIELKG